MSEVMFCPICGRKLEITGQARLQTIIEHVESPNDLPCLKDKYQCVNSDCIAYLNSKWGEDGGYYSGDVVIPQIQFKYGIKEAMPSIERQLAVECYKHDEDRYYTICNFNKLKLVLKKEYSYQANEWGRILKRTYKWKWIINDTYHISGITMLKHSISEFHRHKKKYNEGKMEKDYVFRKRDWDRRWWYLLTCLYIKIFYPSFYGDTREVI
jgi:hypothetical protein